MPRHSTDLIPVSLKGRIWLAVAVMVVFNCVCGVIALLTAAFIKLDNFFAFLIATMLSSPLMFLLGKWLSNEVRRPVEKIARIAKSLERNPGTSLPRTSGAVETDILLHSLHRISRQHQNLITMVRDAADNVGCKAVGPSSTAPARSKNCFETPAEAGRPNRDPGGAITAGCESSVRHARDLTLKIEFLANTIRETAEQLNRTTNAQRSHLLQTFSGITKLIGQLRETSAAADTSLAVDCEWPKDTEFVVESDCDCGRAVNGIRGHVQETAKRIKLLGERVQEIGQIVSQFERLSEEANLVALNTSLRSAAASPEFAVVAREAKRLAEQCDRLTRQISDLSHSVTAETGQVVASMENTIREVVIASGLAKIAGRSTVKAESVSVRLTERLRAIGDISKLSAENAELIASEIKVASETSVPAQGFSDQTLDSVEAILEAAATLRHSLSKIAFLSEASNLQNPENTESLFVNQVDYSISDGRTA